MFASLAGPFSRLPYWNRSGDGSVIGEAAYYFDASTGISLGAGNEVLAWQGGGQFPIALAPFSTGPVLNGDTVEFSEASTLSYTLQIPFDLVGGFSAWMRMRVPDATLQTGARRPFRLLDSSQVALLQAIFPSGTGTVLMTGGGTNVTASGLSNQDLETFAVWGFEWNAAEGTAEITRGGVTVSTAPTGSVDPVPGYARVDVGIASTVQIEKALMFLEPRRVTTASILNALQ